QISLGKGDTEHDAEVYWYHNDVSGMPRELTGAGGEIAWRAEYRAWGNTLRVEHIETRAGEPVYQPLRYQGQYFDAETGLHYNRFRYYDPDAGRFISQDPIGLAGGINLYQYAPNPLVWVDPLGLLKCGLTGNEVGDASNLPVIKPGTKEWKQAVDTIKNNGSSKPNFRVADRATAEKLMKEAKPKIPEYGQYTGSKNYRNKEGYEHHPNESHTVNAPENNLPHIKWSDYTSGKKAPSSGKGHIFYDE
ncbi:RHS repeat-associated core domain-containing protein, partial [Cronobacter malonaticus]